MTGDERQAVTRLYERYAGAVHRYALRRSDRETADDITAQVFMVAWRRRSAHRAGALDIAFKRMGDMVLEYMDLIERGLPPLRSKRAERETVSRMRSKPVDRN